MDIRTLTCGNCGGEEFNIRFMAEIGGDKWAECADCGRPTSAVGEGWRKQRKWEAEN